MTLDPVLGRRVWSNRQLRARLADDEQGGGGGGVSNWAVIALDGGIAPLTHAVPAYTFLVADVTIQAQSGTDFSIVDGGSGFAAVASAGGGYFQAAVFIDPPQDSTLDGGSSKQRWLSFGLVIGGDNAGINAANVGLALTVPIILPSSYVEAAGASAPGHAAPGGLALQNMAVNLSNAFGTDSVPVDEVFSGIALWQL